MLAAMFVDHGVRRGVLPRSVLPGLHRRSGVRGARDAHVKKANVADPSSFLACQKQGSPRWIFFLGESSLVVSLNENSPNCANCPRLLSASMKEALIVRVAPVFKWNLILRCHHGNKCRPHQQLQLSQPCRGFPCTLLQVRLTFECLVLGFEAHEDLLRQEFLGCQPCACADPR
ncbi:hypothetical protein BCR44DRAFT_252706 [Catenaria anguillulae PL171]|uniref:Uncharacterized protein n=1 Tax=Catenaria anguillulae PL171 TaxID=765915 RepID=A0A1Y2H7M9_9FUNG|nr:hypothetical protein BCR44DRAFT_252706 [Catenaria anguillulae PL171]